MKSSQERESSQGRIRADLIVSVTLVLQVYTNGKELLVKKKESISYIYLIACFLVVFEREGRVYKGVEKIEEAVGHQNYEK